MRVSFNHIFLTLPLSQYGTSPMKYFGTCSYRQFAQKKIYITWTSVWPQCGIKLETMIAHQNISEAKYNGIQHLNAYI